MKRKLYILLYFAFLCSMTLAADNVRNYQHLFNNLDPTTQEYRLLKSKILDMIKYENSHGPINIELGYESNSGKGETFEDAVHIEAFPFSDTGTTEGFTNDYGPYINPEYSKGPIYGVTGAAADVVYYFTLDGAGTVTIDLCGSGYDTAIAVFDHQGNLLAVNDDHCTGFRSYLEYDLAAGEYYIVVDGFDESEGDYELTVDIKLRNEKDNNLNVSEGSITNHPYGNNRLLDGGSCSTALPANLGLNNATGLDQWFWWTAPADGYLFVSSCIPGQDADTRVGVYLDCSYFTGDIYENSYMSNDDSGCSYFPYAAIASGDVTAGVTYYIFWDDYWGPEPFTFELTFDETIYGCTDYYAENYNPDAEVDDGSCYYYSIYGCTDPDAINYNSEATIDDGSCIYDCSENEITVLMYDSYGDGWNGNILQFTDAAGNVAGSAELISGDYGEHGFCLDDGGYIVTCDGGYWQEEVSWEITDGYGNTLLGGGCPFNGSLTLGEGETVPGCTDPDAVNYNPYANMDDGSCYYEYIYGCTDPDAVNYNPDASQDDGSCYYEYVYGCTDPDAVNYNPDANQDDGSCYYEGIYGCTDPEAVNYNPGAEVDDGSCKYEGCTDPDAVNYDPDADIDDGSCEYEGCTDPDALNFDPDADIDDGSCIYDPDLIGCTDPDAENYDPLAEWDDGSCIYPGPNCSMAVPYYNVDDPTVYGSTTEAYDVDWYVFYTNGSYSIITATLCGSEYDTRIAVFDYCDADIIIPEWGGPDNAIAYNDDGYCDDGGWSFQSTVLLGDLPSGEYWVAVYGYGESYGDYQLTIAGEGGGAQPDPPFNVTAEGLWSTEENASVIEWCWEWNDSSGNGCTNFDCTGNCADDYLDWLGDGSCDDGSYGVDFNCADFNYDEGDCSGGETCGPGYVIDCSGDGDCCLEGWIGDGYMDCEDQAYGCDLTCYNNDGGDCAGDAATGNNNPVIKTGSRKYIIHKMTEARLTQPYRSLESGIPRQSQMMRTLAYFTLYISYDGVDYEFDTYENCLQVYGFDPGSYVCAYVTATDDAGIESDPSEEACAESGIQQTCPCEVGDYNCDGTIDVIDIVELVDVILNFVNLSECDFYYADVNGDGDVNVVDIVEIVSIILNPRSDNADSAVFIKLDNELRMEADGYVGGVQITLSHSSDFTLQLSEDALVADYRTWGNLTTLIIINPGSNELFTSSGDYEVVEYSAATAEGFINASLLAPTEFSLSTPYPNPFNPVTSLTVELPVDSYVSVQVYNVMGQMVEVLADGPMSAGYHDLTWDAGDAPSGMYFIRSIMGSEIRTQKVMLLK